MAHLKKQFLYVKMSCKKEIKLRIEKIANEMG